MDCCPALIVCIVQECDEMLLSATSDDNTSITSEEHSL